MINKIKPYYVILIHEDESDDDGIPTEVLEYTWTRRGAEKVQRSTYAKMERPYPKFVAVFPANWLWWWTINCGTVFMYVRYDEETETFLTTRIGWWSRERLWKALWKVVRR